MPLLVKQNVSADPCRVGLFRAPAVMAHAQGLSNAIHQPRCRRADWHVLARCQARTAAKCWRNTTHPAGPVAGPVTQRQANGGTNGVLVVRRGSPASSRKRRDVEEAWKPSKRNDCGSLLRRAGARHVPEPVTGGSAAAACERRLWQDGAVSERTPPRTQGTGPDPQIARSGSARGSPASAAAIRPST